MKDAKQQRSEIVSDQNFDKFTKIRAKRRNALFCKFTRQWLIVCLMLFTSIVLFLNVFPRYYTGQNNYNSGIRYVRRENQADAFIPKETFITKETKEKETDFCDVIHVGIVCTGYKSSLLFQNLLKSIFFHRANPIHLHIITDKATEYVLNTLMYTWDLPDVNYTFYDLNGFVNDIKWVPNSHYSGVFGMLKLLFPNIVPLNVTNKILVLDTDITVVSDIYELWKLFDNFKNKQAIGIVENESDFYLSGNVWPAIGKGFNSGVLLYNIERLKQIDWMKIWPNITKRTASFYGTAKLADQDVINAVLKEHPEILYEVPCYWNTQLSDNTKSKSCYSTNRIKIVHWNSPKKFNVINKDIEYFRSLATTYMEYNGNLLRRQLLNCDNDTRYMSPPSENVCDEFRKASETKWRTLLFFRSYDYKLEDNGVTFVAQCSFERLPIIEEIANFWSGPISFTLYLSDAELTKSNEFISHSDILSDRNNIAYHVVFKEGDYYPVNILRNIGLSNVDTPYVFLADVDFVPVPRLCESLRNYLQSQTLLKNEALIIPAFEMTYFTDSVPRNKTRLLHLWEKRRVMPFLERIWPAGHSPTNYQKWAAAEDPYKVKWDHDFEPYIVVRSNVSRYDERFVGFGWNKVSHIMELEAQGYDFIVLPNVFIVHKPHNPSSDMTSFRTSPQYRQCLQYLKEEFIQNLNKRYGRNFELQNITIAFPPVKRRKRNFDVVPTTEETNTDYPYIQ